MNFFRYHDGALHAEGVDLNALADVVGTPFYCYSSATLERHYRVFAASFPQDSLVAFSVKALGNVAVLPLEASVKARMSYGGTAPDRVREQLRFWKEKLK